MRRPFLATMLLLAVHDASAQGTLDDYRRASNINQRFANLTVGVVAGGPNWIGASNQFWYRVSVTGGNRYVLVDADAWSKQPAFDHDRLATGLSAATGSPHTAITLPFTTFAFVDNRESIEADANGSKWRCSLASYACSRIGAATAGTGRGGGAAQGRAGGGGGGRGAAWNSGVSLAGTTVDRDDADDGAPPYGFFESPSDERPPYWWW